MHDYINFMFLLKPTNWHAVIVDSMYLYNLLILIMVSDDDVNVIDVCLKIKHDVHVHLHIIIYIFTYIYIFKHARSVPYRSHDKSIQCHVVIHTYIDELVRYIWHILVVSA